MISAIEIPGLAGYVIDTEGRVYSLRTARELRGWEHYSQNDAGPYRRYEILGGRYYGHRLAWAVWNDVPLGDLDGYHVHHRESARSTLDCRPCVLEALEPKRHAEQPGHMNGGPRYMDPEYAPKEEAPF